MNVLSAWISKEAQSSKGTARKNIVGLQKPLDNERRHFSPMSYLRKGITRNLKDSSGRFHCLMILEKNFRLKPSACDMNPQHLNISWLQSPTCKSFSPYCKSRLAIDRGQQ